MEKRRTILRHWATLLLFILTILQPQEVWALSVDTDGYYKIGSSTDLSDFRNLVNNGSTSINGKLTSSFTISNGAYTPIGTSGNPYSGTFDGKGNTITFSGATTSSGDFGLFGYVSGATIQNLEVAGTLTVSGTCKHIGGIVGSVKGATTIKGCTFSGSISASNCTDSNGGIVGYCEKNSQPTITNCWFSGTFSAGNGTLGGILGYADDDGGQSFVGITNCFVSGTLSPSTGTNVGIFAGQPRGNVPGVIKNNTYISSTTTNMLGNGKTADSSNKKISISAGTGGEISSISYINPTATAATQATVTATPNSDYHFKSWSGSSTSTTTTVTVTLNSILTANFEQHNFSSASATSTYLKTAASCVSNAEYYYKCSGCSAKGSETWTKSGTMLNHDFSQKKQYLTNKASDETCTKNATYYYVCNGCGKEGNATWVAEGTKLGHDYADGVWGSWSDDGHSITCSRTCKRSTCTSSTTGHVVSVTATLQNGGVTSKVKTAATCLTKGWTSYTANATVAGTKYTSGAKDVQDIAALGHDYAAGVWGSWSADGHSITCSRTCKRSSCTSSTTGHEVSVTATVKNGGVTSKVKTPATCTTKGWTTYTAKATVEGTEYTSKTKDVQDIAALGHAFAENDPNHNVCTNCHHTFLHYTATSEVTPKNGNFYDKDGNVLSYTHTFDSETGKGEFDFDGILTSIGDDAFYKCTSLTSVTIPNSVTSIGDYAFLYCTSLTNVTIPNSVTSIGEAAFYKCTSLTSVTIPNSVTSIGDEAFSDCSSLTNVTIPNSVTSIGESAFYCCSRLASVTIPNSVTSIGTSAFLGCKSLTSVNIPNSVTSIGGNVFLNCSSLASVTIGNSVTSIGYNVFSGCSSLASVTIPNSVTSIGSGAFYGCSNLTSVTIGNSVTSIGESAFSDCSSLASVTIPNSVTSIGDDAFRGCYRLASMTIPNSVTSIGTSVFLDCSNLASVTIGNSVTSIGADAFMNCSSLASVTIPNSVTSIGNAAFCGCTSLESISIPNSVTSINSSTFYNCSSLTSVTIPNSVTYICSCAFHSCISLTSVTIPNSVTSIGDEAFKGCYVIASNYVNNSNQQLDGLKIVDSEQPDGLLIKGNGAIACRKWAKEVTIPNSVTSIYENAFQYGTNLTSVKFQSIPNVVGGAFEEVPSSCQYTLALSDDSYVAADKGDFPPLSAEPTYTHTMAAESQWGTVVLPFEAKSDDKVQLYQISSITDGKVTLAEAESVSAGTPCLFKKKNAAATSVIFTANSKEVSVATPTATTFGDLKLTGAYASQPVSASAGYVLEGNQFKQTTADTEVSPFQAYLSGSIAGVSALKIVIPGHTYIYYTATSEVTLRNGNFYDKDGNKLSYTNTFDSETGNGELDFDGVLTSIGNYAFFNCSSLTCMTIPNSVTSIGNSAFGGCSSLTTLTIPSSVSSIGDYAFQDCSSFTTLTIPSSVSSIGDWAFDNCCVLEKNYVNNSGLEAHGLIIADSEQKDGLMFKGSEAVFCRKWATSVTIPNSVTSIGDYAFSGCFNLNSITIPNSVTSIGNDAFNYCESLTSITIPNSVISIGDAAFQDCTSLPIVDNIRYADTYLVEAIKGYSEYTIKEGTRFIGNSAFEYCKSLTTVTIPNSVTSIGTSVFLDCSNLASVTIGNSVTSIGDAAFMNCSSLASITIPNSVISIGDAAFYLCSNLTSVEFQSIPEVGGGAFNEVSSSCQYTLALSDDSYVAADKGEFPTLSDKPTYRREMSTQWGTIVVPFDVAIDANEPYDFYELESVTADVLSLKKVTGTLAAGTPVLVRMSGAKNAEGKYILSLEAADCSVSTDLSDGSSADGLTLTGAYAKKVLTTESGYIISNNSFMNIETLHTKYPNSAISIGAFRAYLSGSLSNNAPQLRLSVYGEGIETALEVFNSLSKGETLETYDLNGRRLDDLQQGVNIIKRGSKSIKIVIK